MLAAKGGGEQTMFIDPQKSSVDIREMKVRIPSDYYMKLHSLKLLTGTQISEAVTEALKIYFQRESAAKAEGRAEAASRLL